MIYHKLKNNSKEIVKLYTIDKLSADKISKIFDCDPGAVRYHLRKHGIKSIKRWERVDYGLSSVQKDIVIGGLLGDSSIPRLYNNQRNHRIVFSHCEKHREYVEWKHTMMGKFSKSSVTTTNGETNMCRFGTISHPEFNKFYKMFYKNGKKIFPMFEMNERIFSVWFMDDGSCSRNKARLATNKFSEKENDKICQVLFDKFGIHAKKRFNKIKKSFYIDISMKDNDIVKNIVSSHIVSCMSYKVPTPYRSRYL